MKWLRESVVKWWMQTRFFAGDYKPINSFKIDKLEYKVLPRLMKAFIKYLQLLIYNDEK